MIDQNTIERVLETARIEEVIQDFVSLKKRGVNYIGLCPFHNEKTPSFTVSPSKGIFKCFGCGKGGNSAHFIMEHEHLNFIEAIKYLAKKYNIEIEERELSEEEKLLSNERESMLIVSSFAQKYFNDMLLNNDRGIAIGLSYFRERGFNDTIINKFGLGYCPDGGDDFTKSALAKGYKIEYLEKTGLSITRENRSFDRFKGRVMFPIHNIAGRVIGFGGRTLSTDKKIAKYLNSPESEIYHKSKVLYGLFQAKNTIVKNDLCYLVEGYTDVISLHQSGIENVVASSGTSLTEGQINLLKRFSQNVCILYDSDPAGIKASQRGINMLLEQGINVSVVLFPEGEDPDSYARNHSNTELLDYINNNTDDFIRFKTNLLLAEAKNDPIKRAGLIRDVVESIAVISDGIKRTVYLQECSNILEIDEQILYAETAKLRRRKFQEQEKQKQRENLKLNNPPTPPVPSFLHNVYSETLEKEIIRVLLLYGNEIIRVVAIDEPNRDPDDIKIANYVITEIRNDELELSNLIYLKIFEEIEKFASNNIDIKPEHFINHHDPELSHVAALLCSQGYKLSKLWSKYGSAPGDERLRLSSLVPELIMSFKRNILELGLEKIQKLIVEAETNKNFDRLKELASDQIKIMNLIYKLSKIQNRVLLR
ncbi:MAG: DNA primase [Bacteroidales bacterium]|nr:DNA primase [Bacteroidales bacterium]MDD4235703.1 DNA primase [Bacteroidales bacterium]MDY0160136.1 DNA primase [Bacteroidales bacterium]